MNNIYKTLFVLGFFALIISCTTNNTPEETPLRDYAEQYATDIDVIDDYIDTHYITVDPTNFDVAFTEIPTGGTQQNVRTQTQYPLLDTTVTQNGVNYKIYYIRFREGTQRRPTQVDSVHVSYKGIDLKDKQFDYAESPTWFKLPEVISGWSHIIPMFKTGTYTGASGSTPASFNDFGAGIMFLPSGLAYYNNGAGTIAAYSPIIFSFKLYELQYRDQDGDGIKSKDERKLDPSVSHLIRWKENPGTNTYKLVGGVQVTDIPFLDTDGDGISNAYDIDDDGDNYLTKVETQKLPADITTTSPLAHYPFNPTSTEPKGIPACGNVDFTSPTRLRKHLDPSCH